MASSEHANAIFSAKSTQGQERERLNADGWLPANSYHGGEPAVGACFPAAQVLNMQARNTPGMSFAQNRLSWHGMSYDPRHIRRTSSSPTSTDGPATISGHDLEHSDCKMMSLPPNSSKLRISRKGRPGDCIHEAILLLLNDDEWSHISLVMQPGLKPEQLSKLNEAMVAAFRCRARNSSQTSWSLCHEHNCQVWHRLVGHEQRCVLAKRPDGGCRGVRELHDVARYHAGACTEAQCPVVFCRYVKTVLESSPLYSSRVASLAEADESLSSSPLGESLTNERGVPVPGGGKQLRAQVLAMSFGTKRSVEPFSLSSIAPSLGKKRPYSFSNESPQLSILHLGEGPLTSLVGKAHLPIEDEKEVLFACNRKYLPVSTSGFCEEGNEWQRVTSIGSGSFGRCLLCRPFSEDASRIFSTHEHFVAKIVEWRQEVIEEVRLWSKLNHPHILPLWGAVRINKRVFLYTEFMVGLSVADMLIDPDSGAPQPLDELHALGYLEQVLLGLEYMHGNGLLHRDVKGRNVLLADADGIIAKLADFGTALDTKRSSPPGGSQVVSQPWMSPEVARNENDCEHGSRDIWAAGCFLYEMVVARPPWHEKSVATLIYVIGTCSEETRPTLPAGMSKFTRQMYAHMLDLDRAKRPTATQLLESIKVMFPRTPRMQSLPATGGLLDSQQSRYTFGGGERVRSLTVPQLGDVGSLPGFQFVQELSMNHENISRPGQPAEPSQKLFSGFMASPPLGNTMGQQSVGLSSGGQETASSSRRCVAEGWEVIQSSEVYQDEMLARGAVGARHSAAEMPGHVGQQDTRERLPAKTSWDQSYPAFAGFDSAGTCQSIQSDYAAEGPLTEEEWSGKISLEEQDLSRGPSLSSSVLPASNPLWSPSHSFANFSAQQESSLSRPITSPSIPIPRRDMGRLPGANRIARPLSVTESFLSLKLDGGSSISSDMMFPGEIPSDSFDKEGEVGQPNRCPVRTGHEEIDSAMEETDGSHAPSDNVTQQSSSLPYQVDMVTGTNRTPHTAPMAYLPREGTFGEFSVSPGSGLDSRNATDIIYRRTSLSDLSRICCEDRMTPESHNITKVTLYYEGEVLTEANVPKPSTFADVATNSYDEIKRRTSLSQFTFCRLSEDKEWRPVPSCDRVAKYSSTASSIFLSVVDSREQEQPKGSWHVCEDYSGPRLVVHS